MARTIATLAAAAALATLASCGSAGATRDPAPLPVATPKATAAARTTPTPTPTQNFDVEAYLEAVTAGAPAGILEGRKYAAPGSVADGYLTYLADVREAMLDSGMGAETIGDLTAENGGYTYCPIEEQCTRFDQFTIKAGRITDLHVDGKSPGPRLTIGTGAKVKAAGATFQLLSAYRSIQADALYVTVEVRTTKAISVNTTLATYRAADGKQRTAVDAYGPSEIGADSNAKIAVTIPGVAAGGTLTLDGCGDPDCETGYTTRIKVGG